MSDTSKLRIDKWLWAVRVFKTRSLATDACHAGRIKIEGNSVKASYMLKVGETVTINKEGEKKILKVVTLLEKRVGAPLAAACYEDLTPPPEPKDAYTEALFYYPADARRKKGEGRPTKKERRRLDEFTE
ncbi:MAG TPA: RNA-binding S4 domain-containing protein [Chitinophagales bacterium]|nr:RNA-binding S4 domain-containing protein [Chitinophagales bacterium]HRK29018.1 RNA-binding S4 domain-containing protein [Chitinophagales bacterium]